MKKFIRQLYFIFIFVVGTINAQFDFLGVAPLQVGNKWVYTNTIDGTEVEYISYAITDSNIVKNSKSFYEVLYSRGEWKTNIYLRKDSSFYYLYNESYTDSLYRYIKPDIAIYDNWLQYAMLGGDSVEVYTEVVDTGSGNVFGEHVESFKLVRTTVLLGTGETWNYKYGRIKSIIEQNTQTLIGCVINGVLYGDTTLTSVESGNQSPNIFHLSQNYPNPFNPTTKIKFTLPNVGAEYVHPQQTKLIVYDILGRQITTLIKEELSSGVYEINFDGSRLSSGVYFYKLTFGGFAETKKMMVIK